MAKLSLKDLCLFCYLPFGQGDHADCLKCIRHLKFNGVRDQQLAQKQVRFLSSVYWKGKEIKTCSRCGKPHRWRSRDCRAHTREWVRAYGGRIRNANYGANKAVSKANRGGVS